jgi:hypothetical protein
MDSLFAWHQSYVSVFNPLTTLPHLFSFTPEIDAGSEEMSALYKASILGQSQSEQGFLKPSRTVQEQLTNSIDEFVSCVSDTLTGNSGEEETAMPSAASYAPLGVASPQSIQSVEELEEELPAVTDCTTLALADAAQGESASLIEENQDCGVETIFPHEDTCSAALIAQNEKFLNSAMATPAAGIADQKIEPNRPSASLLVENSVSGVEIKADHEGEGSAALVTEKWSHEAIVARSNMRPVRREKLNRAANSGENPGFDFLQECWNDDPALQIVIKKLLAKFPQWGIAIVDEVLIDWNAKLK